MTLDPDGGTCWFTSQYYNTDDLNHLTRIGSFKFAECSTVANGSLQGKVTAAGTTDPISGAVVSLGTSRTTTTDASGEYQFTNLPSGRYPALSVTAAGFGKGG